MKSFFMALSMFTVFPCPRAYDENRKRTMLLWLPAVGALIGLLWYFFARLIGLTGLRFLSAALLSVFPWAVSGFIHIDGFMDCADAVMSGAPYEKKLEILKDPRVGAFAVIMTALLVLLTFAGFAEADLAGREAVLIFIPAFSRALSAAAALNMRPHEKSSYAAMFESGAGSRGRLLPVLAAAAILAVSFAVLKKDGLVLAAELFGFAAPLLYLNRELKGVSGDVSGCCITVSEFFAVIAAAVIKSV